MVQAFRRLAVTVFLLFFVVPDSNALASTSPESALEQADQSEQAQAAEGESDGAPIDLMGKISDHHYLDVMGYHLELPRIILAGGQWHFYGSTHAAVESGRFTEDHGALTYTGEGEIALDMSITSHLMFFWFAVGLTGLLTLMAVRRYDKGVGRETAPRGWFHNLFEITFLFVRDDIARGNIPESKYRKFLPYLFCAFVSITFMNLFGLLPWGVTATADLTVTGTLAFMTFFLTQWNGSKDHWEHVFWFPGVPGWMRIILTPIELLGLFTKPIALAVRLFANMLSGKIMIIIVLGLIFIFADGFGTTVGIGTSFLAVPLTVLMYVLKAFVGVLQAYIFTLLSAVFIGMAVEEHEHHDEAVEAHA
ncbi:MAG: F0F1 ATP synthase subunit A [Balneolaceae bacterium]|nr:F0F1 ATP synthase subunit A [Balneolaceae bacterium]